MKLINLGKCDKHLIYPLIGGISNFTVSLILVYYRDSVEINKHPFILGINAGFGMSLAIFPYISQLRTMLSVLLTNLMIATKKTAIIIIIDAILLFI